MKTATDVVNTDLAYIKSQLKDELQELRGKRLLITGGGGFLGYYLVLTILANNDDLQGDERTSLTVLDNFMRGMPDWLSDAGNRDDLDIVTHNIVDPLPSNTEDFGYIIHAASIASPIYYRQHPLATMDANVLGLRHLLDYSKSRADAGNGIDGFLYFSSSEIYGDPMPENIPTSEEYRGNVACIGPRACYDESKRYGETLSSVFALRHGVPVRIARPFNNYGPGLKISDRRALPDFARDVLNGRDICLLSDGGPTRTFCYIADAIVGYLKILVRGRDGEPYNIGTPSPEISIRELAEEVVQASRELFDYRGKIVFAESDDAEYLIDNPVRRCPVIEKASNELGYVPTIGLSDGIRRSLLWYSENKTGADL